MKTLTQQLANYAAYHRDRRNIATHFVGIPMIAVAVAVLLARPAVVWQGWTLSPALAVAVLTAACAPIGARLQLRMKWIRSSWLCRFPATIHAELAKSAPSAQAPALTKPQPR